MSMFGLKEAEVAELVRAVAGRDLHRDAIEERFARATWSGIAEPGDGVAGLVIDAIGAPRALAAVVERALVRDPTRRWQSAREMRAALEACLPEVRPVRTSDLVGANRTPIATPMPAHDRGSVTGAATPVGGAAAGAPRARQLPRAARPRPAPCGRPRAAPLSGPFPHPAPKEPPS